MLYVPMMKMFFKWFASEISEKENQDAVERLYYLALLSVRNLMRRVKPGPISSGKLPGIN